MSVNPTAVNFSFSLDPSGFTQGLATAQPQLDAFVASGTLAVQTLQQTGVAGTQAGSAISTLAGQMQSGDQTFQQSAAQRLAIQQNLRGQLQGVNDQIVQDNQKSARQSADPWKQAADDTARSFGKSVSSIVAGKASVRDAAIAFARQMVLKEVEADAQAFASKMLYSILHLQQDQKTAQGGLLFHLLGLAGKQTLNQQDVAQTVGTEAAKTGAVSAGEAARTGIKAAGSIASKGVDALDAKSNIGARAASAAATAWDQAIKLPGVGLVLAPVLAATTFAGVMAFGSMIPSFAVGAWELPGDTLAQVHKGEMIVPATFSDGLRSALSGDGGASSDGGDSHTHVHLHAVDAQSFEARLNDHARAIAKAVVGVQATNPSLRGSW